MLKVAKRTLNDIQFWKKNMSHKYSNEKCTQTLDSCKIGTYLQFSFKTGSSSASVVYKCLSKTVPITKCCKITDRFLTCWFLSVAPLVPVLIYTCIRALTEEDNTRYANPGVRETFNSNFNPLPPPVFVSISVISPLPVCLLLNVLFFISAVPISLKAFCNVW